MGLGIVIVFYLVGSVILFGFARAICDVVWLLVRTRLPKLRPWLITLPFVIGMAPTVLLAAGLLWINFKPPGVRFDDVFDVPAGQDIQHLKASGSGTSDAEIIDLAFSANEAGWRSLVGPPFRKIEDADEIRDIVPLAGSDLPTWWKGDRCADRTVHVARDLREWDHIVVTRCRTDALVYVQARWID